MCGSVQNRKTIILSFSLDFNPTRLPELETFLALERPIELHQKGAARRPYGEPAQTGGIPVIQILGRCYASDSSPLGIDCNSG